MCRDACYVYVCVTDVYTWVYARNMYACTCILPICHAGIHKIFIHSPEVSVHTTHAFPCSLQRLQVTSQPGHFTAYNLRSLHQFTADQKIIELSFGQFTKYRLWSDRLPLQHNRFRVLPNTHDHVAIELEVIVLWIICSILTTLGRKVTCPTGQIQGQFNLSDKWFYLSRAVGHPLMSSPASPIRLNSGWTRSPSRLMLTKG